VSAANEAADPTIYADISQSAQDAAVSFDGIRVILGGSLGFYSFGASIYNGNTPTNTKVNAFDICLNMEYSKSLKKGFLVGFTIGANISQKSKKDGSWNDLNSQYENHIGNMYPGVSHTGTVEKDALCPEIALKLGYQLSGYPVLLYIKVGLSKIGVTYNYRANENHICHVEANNFVPKIYIGFEKKFNKMWGVSLEANTSIARQKTTNSGGMDHKTKLSQKAFSIFATYRVSH
jgi:hypothetical protein